jgi:Ca2+-binding RTX toxin-like protein
VSVGRRRSTRRLALGGMLALAAVRVLGLPAVPGIAGVASAHAEGTIPTTATFNEFVGTMIEDVPAGLSVEVCGLSGGEKSPGGTVTFTEGAAVLGVVPVDGRIYEQCSSVTFDNTELPGGNHTITARYSGDDTYGPSAAETNVFVLGENNCAGQPGAIVGTDGDDRLIGTPGPDLICASMGADIVHAGEGDDIILGGPGADDLTGGDGVDVIAGGYGDDLIHAGAGSDTVAGGYGNDRVYGGPGDDVVYGGPGVDTLRGGDGDDSVLGTGGNDTVLGEDGDDALDGGAGVDHVKGAAGNDTVAGGPQDDVLEGMTGDDVIIGSDDRGYDVMDGGADFDVCLFGAGDIPIDCEY